MRIKDIKVIERIGNENLEIDVNDIPTWGAKQNDETDLYIEKELNENIFSLSKRGFLKYIFNKINNSNLPIDKKNYAKNRVMNCNCSLLDESYIGTKNNVELNMYDVSDWDFKTLGIEFDLKNSVLPKRNGDTKFKNCSSILKEPEEFIRQMYLESSCGTRASEWHRQSNRFFMIYFSKKDEKYFEKTNTINTQKHTKYLSKINFNARKKAIDYIFDNLTMDNIFELNDVKYFCGYGKDKKLKKYNKVYCVICLIGEQENEEIKTYIVKKN